MAMSEEPLFSVLCTNFNNGPFISDMVHSLLNQTYGNWELIFVDDGSSDNSLSQIEPFQTDPRIRVLSLNNNIGAGAAAQIAASEARGAFMGRLDADDALTPDAINVMINAHLLHPTASLVTSQVIACDSQLKPAHPPWHKNKKLPQGKSILEHPTVGHFATFKTLCFLKTNGFQADLRRAVDLDIYVKLEETGKVIVLDDQLYLYRKNSSGISQGHNGILAKSLAYQVMVTAYFRRKLAGHTPNLSRQKARELRLRQHQIDISQPLPIIHSWQALISAWKTFPELLFHPTIWRNTFSATLRNLRRTYT